MNSSQSTGAHALEVSRTTRDIERSFDGSILSLPLIPSFVAFVAAVSSSVVYNVTDVNTCPLYLRAFVLGNIVWSYVFILSYGFILVGPKMNDIIGTLLIFIIHFVLHLALVLFGSVQIYTSWNEGGSCVRNSRLMSLYYSPWHLTLKNQPQLCHALSFR